jgi:hypothetical protein
VFVVTMLAGLLVCLPVHAQEFERGVLEAQVNHNIREYTGQPTMRTVELGPDSFLRLRGKVSTVAEAVVDFSIDTIGGTDVGGIGVEQGYVELPGIFGDRWNLRGGRQRLVMGLGRDDLLPGRLNIPARDKMGGDFPYAPGLELVYTDPGKRFKASLMGMNRDFSTEEESPIDVYLQGALPLEGDTEASKGAVFAQWFDGHSAGTGWGGYRGFSVAGTYNSEGFSPKGFEIGEESQPQADILKGERPFEERDIDEQKAVLEKRAAWDGKIEYVDGQDDLGKGDVDIDFRSAYLEVGYKINLGHHPTRFYLRGRTADISRPEDRNGNPLYGEGGLSGLPKTQLVPYAYATSGERLKPVWAVGFDYLHATDSSFVVEYLRATRDDPGVSGSNPIKGDWGVRFMFVTRFSK